MYSRYLQGCIEEQPGRPEIVGKVVSAGLQLGRQAAVADQHGIVGQGEHHGVTLRLFLGCPLGPITAATRQGHGGAFRGAAGASQAICSAEHR